MLVVTTHTLGGLFQCLALIGRQAVQSRKQFFFGDFQCRGLFNSQSVKALGVIQQGRVPLMLDTMQNFGTSVLDRRVFGRFVSQ